MNDDHNELPESARRAFADYPHLDPSAAFNRAVLDSLASAQSKRRQTLVGRLEEFLGVGLWSFAASGALGAFVPVTLLGILMCSQSSAPRSAVPDGPLPPNFPLRLSPYRGPMYARELEEYHASAL